MDQLLGIKDVSELLKVKESTIRSWVFQKRIPFLRVGGRLVRFPMKELQMWLRKNAQGK